MIGDQGSEPAQTRRLKLGGKWLKRDLLRLYVLAVLGLLVALLWLWVWRAVTGVAIDWQPTFEAITDAVTAAAILVGGGWTVYVLQRRRAHTVRGEIRHRYSLWHHSGQRMLRIGVSLRNCGDVALDPGVSYTLVQLPPVKAPQPQEEAESTWTTLARIEHPWQEDLVIVEPGEIETYYYDVALPPDGRYVQVSTIVKLPESAAERFHLDEATLVDLEQATRGQG